MELKEMESLVEQGTRYFLTTPVFNVDKFAKFCRKVEPLGVPIIAEVLVLHSGMQARMLKRISNIDIPDHLIVRMENAPVKFDESAKILLEMVEQLKDICAGVHVLPFGWETKIGKVLQEIRRWR